MLYHISKPLALKCFSRAFPRIKKPMFTSLKT